MNTWNRTFNETWNLLAGRDSRVARDEGARARLRAVKIAERYRGYLLAANTTTGANTAGTINIARTPVLTFPALVRDVNFLTTPFMEIQITRTNPSRTQMSNEFLWNNLYGTSQLNGLQNPGIPFSKCPWVEPFNLMTNELLQVRFQQTVTDAPRADFQQGATFRVIGLNRMPCPIQHWQEVEDYIRRNRVQHPLWLTTFSDDAQTITFPSVATGQRTVATTREAPEPLLLTAFAFPIPFFVNLNNGATKPKIRIVSSDGHILTPEPVLIGSLYDFSGFTAGGPGGGWLWWYELPIPHYLPQGGTVTVEITDFNATAGSINVDELVWRATTV